MNERIPKERLMVVDLAPNTPSGIDMPVYRGDVGFDLRIADDTRVPHDRVVDAATGVRVALPDGTWGLVVGRSSAERKLGVRVTLGVIDWGYTGELFVSMQSVDPNVETMLGAGTRVAQLIVVPAVIPHVMFGPVPTDRERGANGFGSTGHA